MPDITDTQQTTAAPAAPKAAAPAQAAPAAPAAMPAPPAPAAREKGSEQGTPQQPVARTYPVLAITLGALSLVLLITAALLWIQIDSRDQAVAQGENRLEQTHKPHILGQRFDKSLRKPYRHGCSASRYSSKICRFCAHFFN